MANIKDLGTKIKTVISETALNQIKYLCNKISTVEWSGALFYSLDGSVEDPKNLTITLESILPLDRGTSGFTSYNLGVEVVEFMEENEVFERGWHMGHIHSHHNMRVFFSGTDTSELVDNAPNHNFYLSIIVNNKMEVVGKLCISATSNVEEKEIGFSAINEEGEEYFIESVAKKEEKKLFSYDCDIKFPEPEIVVSEEFEKLFSQMKSHRPVYNSSEYSGMGYQQGYQSRGSYYNYGYEEDDDYGHYGASKYKTSKAPDKNVVQKTKLDESSRLINNIAIELLMLKDPQAGKFTKIEDVLDYLNVMDADGNELAADVKKDYTSIVQDYYGDDNSTVPHLHILQSLIEMFNKHLNTANKDIYNILEPVVAVLKAKQMMLIKN